MALVVFGGLVACGDDIPDVITGTTDLPIGAVTSTSTGGAPMEPSTSSNTPGSTSDATTSTGASSTGGESDTTGSSDGATASGSSESSTGEPVDPDGTYDDCVNVPARVCEPDATCLVDDVAMPTIGVCTPTPCAEASDCPEVLGGTAPPQCTDLDGDATTECSLDCSAGQTCPETMVCHDDQWCAHPLDPPVACADVDLGFALPAVAMGTTSEMGNDTAPICTLANAADVAFEWTAPATGSYRISTEGSMFDTVLYAFLGCGTDQVACNDDAGMLATSELLLDLEVGQTVIAVVDGFNAVGPFVLTIDALVFDGDCCQQHETPGCEVSEIETCVCAEDNFCCIVEWDDICAANAAEDCGATCPS